MDPGRTIGWFGGVFDLVPDFFNYISGETVGNFLMFLPFGMSWIYRVKLATIQWSKLSSMLRLISPAIRQFTTHL